MLRVVFCLPPEKLSKLGWQKKPCTCAVGERPVVISFVPDQQTLYDVVVCKATTEESPAQGRIVVDPLEHQRTISDRGKAFEKMKEVTANVPASYEVKSFEEMDALFEAEKLRFPVIVKPVVGQGTKEAHQMTVITERKGVEGVVFPCFAQDFFCAEHLLKIECVGKEVVMEKWCQAFPTHVDQPCLAFNTADIPATPAEPPETRAAMRTIAEELAEGMQRVFGVVLFGFDLLVHKNEWVVVDINHFPSYGKQFTADQLTVRIIRALEQLGQITTMELCKTPPLETKRRVRRGKAKKEGSGDAAPSTQDTKTPAGDVEKDATKKPQEKERKRRKKDVKKEQGEAEEGKTKPTEKEKKEKKPKTENVGGEKKKVCRRRRKTCSLRSSDDEDETILRQFVRCIDK